MTSVGNYFDATVIRALDEGIGAPGLVQALHGTPRDGSLELATGAVGPQGPEGEPARPFRWEGDIADQAALTALVEKLGRAHAGKAWRVVSTGALAYWNGTGLDTFPEAFGALGPDGESCSVSIGSVTTGPVGSDLQVTVSGPAPDLVLDIVVPRGVKGLKGPDGGPGPIRQAEDYADGAHPDKAVPVWSATTGKWSGQPYPGLRGPWTIVGDRAWDGGPGFAPSQSGVSAASIVVAQLQVPAQDCAWRPMITGGVVVRPIEGSSEFTTRIDAEVRIGSASGQIVALGSGFVTGVHTRARFQPHLAARNVTPGSTVGVIPAGQAVTLFVVVRRGAGSANYDYQMADAQIVCTARPVGVL
ncbi:hypothetical protein NN3_16610 [Nocardia neocaledoniensis NBRC 108232]|uniref:Uncharacterized protein n=1 Tax=Nocardia neocaledoniensis TaxID=236511 RepID=A0A317NQR7_9NOCA|nr:hypothetical protein [Nocardia neocaledoniensis]PWV76018.1 hypothetical protein DFR69_104120 [Nocardia neocaledoniensis]GEM30654.1 hypothetical protein NN3_16610 [Nocardia neocaledoniensis NBRC 108232]